MNIYNTIQTRLDRGQGSTLLSHYTPQGIRRTLLEETPPEPGLSFTQEGDILTLNEVYLPQPRLVILGGGHVALPLCHFAARLGFDVWVYDDRPSFANPTRFPDAHTVICDDFAHMSHRLGLRRTDYVTVLTRGHRHDISCLTTILQGDEVPHYLGMIGSKRRIAIVKEEVSAAIGHTERLDALYAPIGLSIGSVTPEEIALSILAEIVQVKRLAPDGRKRTQEDTVDRDLLHWLSAPDRPPAALVTIVSTTGSTPR
ncbi:MAG: XdhC family protein, partial [Oscillospiraceae bacterium]|nr:XdhC family protein [Oscillospiraceae bacterium]